MATSSWETAGFDSLGVWAGTGDLAEMIGTVAFPVTILDRDARFLYVNHATAAWLGVPPAKLAGRRLREFLDTPQVTEFERRFRHVAESGQTQTFEDEVLLPGSQRWLASVLSPVRVPGSTVPGIMVVAIDITESKLAEARLQERVRFEEFIADAAAEFVVSSANDLYATVKRTLSRLGVLLGVDRIRLFVRGETSADACRTCQWFSSAEMASPLSLAELPWPDYPALSRRLLTGEPWVVDESDAWPEPAERTDLLRLGARSFLWIPLGQAGQPLGGLCLEYVREKRLWPSSLVARLTAIAHIIVNACERLSAEQALARSRDFIAGVTAASPHICYIYDRVLQRNVYASSQITVELGYSPAEIATMGEQFLVQTLHPDDAAQLPALLARWDSVRDDEVIETEYRMRRADGTWRFFHARDKVFQRDAAGRVTQFIGWAEDITERRQAAQDLQRHRTELAHLQRVKSMGEMATGVAHELSQPLYSILNFVQASRNVVDQRPETELREVSDWLRQAALAAGSAGDILRRIRSYVQATPQHWTTWNVRDLLEQTLALMQFELQHREIRARLDVPSSAQDLMISADRVQIQQVLVNLIQNACDAMDSVPPPARELLVGASGDDRQVEFYVRDRGTGLPVDSARIFEPFVSSKPHGLGLGLAISKSIVEEHGGLLAAESNAGSGTTFRFFIPYCKETSQ